MIVWVCSCFLGSLWVFVCVVSFVLFWWDDLGVGFVVAYIGLRWLFLFKDLFMFWHVLKCWLSAWYIGWMRVVRCCFH